MARNTEAFAVSTSLGTCGLWSIVWPLAMSCSIRNYFSIKDGLPDPKRPFKLTASFLSYSSWQQKGHESDARERQQRNTTGKATYSILHVDN